MCSEWRRTITAWWQCSGSLKEKVKREDQRSHGEGQWKRNADRRGGPVGPKPGARHKTRLVGEQELQRYLPPDAERTNYNGTR